MKQVKRDYPEVKSMVELFQVGMDRAIPDFVDAPKGISINVGAGYKQIGDSIPIDYPDWDANNMDLPFKNESVAIIHAYHILEHVDNPVRLLRDFQRVLVKGGVINIVVPYYNSLLQYTDLSHQHAFNEKTISNLFGNTYYNKNKIDWELRIGINVVMGVVEQNLSLCMQLIKE